MSTPQDPRRTPTSADELREVVARKGSFVQTLKAVAWSLLGIRRGAGWQEDISAAKCPGCLPVSARNYISRIEELLGVRVGLISIGPDREQTFRYE